MKFLIIALLFLMSCLSVAAQPGWTDLPNTKLQSVCPPGFGGCSAVVGAWSSAVADTKRNRLINWRGGRNDYYGNEVYALDLNASPVTLKRVINPGPQNPDPTTCPTTGTVYTSNLSDSFKGISGATVRKRAVINQ